MPASEIAIPNLTILLLITQQELIRGLQYLKSYESLETELAEK